MSFFVKRVFRALLTLWFVLTLAFVATRLTGDPTFWLLPDDASPAAREQLLVALGLDKPVTLQYPIYLSGALRGDFGISFYERRPVIDMFAERLPYTLQLAFLALALAGAGGVAAGILAAVYRNSWLDRAIMSLSIAAYSTPNFVLGIVFIFVFSLALGLLPTSGQGTWRHLVMPTIALSASSAALIARITRSSLLDIIGQDYIRTATSKGLRRRAVILKHALRNASLPLLTLIGMQVGTLVAGSVVIETVFAWPGLGRTIVTAVLKRDFPVLQFSLVAVAIGVVTANLIVDLLYSVLDPRVRIGG